MPMTVASPMARTRPSAIRFIRRAVPGRAISTGTPPPRTGGGTAPPWSGSGRRRRGRPLGVEDHAGDEHVDVGEREEREQRVRVRSVSRSTLPAAQCGPATGAGPGARPAVREGCRSASHPTTIGAKAPRATPSSAPRVSGRSGVAACEGDPPNAGRVDPRQGTPRRSPWRIPPGHHDAQGHDGHRHRAATVQEARREHGESSASGARRAPRATWCRSPHRLVSDLKISR